jgi:hypothetical protein
MDKEKEKEKEKEEGRRKKREGEKEWTLMFFFASDNALAPGVVSQLKAIKEAGFHPNVNVVTQFDPRTVGTPTHIFDVNIIEKLRNHGGSDIGFCGSDDPRVRDLLEDKLWRTQKTRHRKNVREEYKKLLKQYENIEDYDPPLPPASRGAYTYVGQGVPQEPSPKESLESFLTFCRTRYPARHYMLFILGHGIVVGNDIFLFDEHSGVDSLTLKELGGVLRGFEEEIHPEGSRLELISFHSCSVSALEVAYELSGTARFMLATQGPAFVGSWPYRQILIRVFKEGSKINVKKLVVDIFYLCLYNSTDFLLAGYSFDLCLCNLDAVPCLTCDLRELSNALVAALPLPPESDPEDDPCGPTHPAPATPKPDSVHPLVAQMAKSFILLSHWKAQSYWQENYIDLFDFCKCFIRLCKDFENATSELDPLPGVLRRIKDACAVLVGKKDVCPVLVGKLEKEGTGKFEEDDPVIPDNEKCKYKVIVRDEYAGPSFQYSHGLSVFFPWSEPESDNPIWSRPEAVPPIVGEYEKYVFETTHWRDFLIRYFKVTKRDTQRQEDMNDWQEDMHTQCGELQRQKQDDFDELREDMASLVYNDEGALSNESALGKPIPTDETGDDCTCPSIKNYPRDTRARSQRGEQAPAEKDEALPISKNFFAAF